MSDSNDPSFIPTSLSASSTPSGILLNWEAPPSGVITGYRVYRALDYTQTLTQVAQVTVTSYLDSDVSLNNTFYYRVTSLFQTSGCEGGGYGTCRYGG